VTVSIHLKKIRSEEHLPKVFSFFDKNGSGYIEIEELKEALSPRGDQKSIDDIFLDVDIDKVRSLSLTTTSKLYHTTNIKFLAVTILTEVCSVGWEDKLRGV
jgi:Ca2+-binding EF-hand superfamily protein